MPEIINHFFDDATQVIPAPNGPIRMTSHNFFGGVSELDKEISQTTVVLPLSVGSLESAMTTAEGGVVQIGPVEVSGGVAPYTYQWYKNGATANNSSSQTPEYTSGTLAAADNGSVYKCVVTDSKGSTATTNDVTVTVTSV